MKFFMNQSIWKKIVIALLIVLLFNAVIMKPVHADTEGDVLEGGGKLLKPIFSLLVTIGDGIVNIIHSSIMNVDESLIKIDTSSPWWGVLMTIIAAVITAACIIGAIILTGGVATVLAWTAVISIASSVLLGSNFIVELEKGYGQAIMSMFDEDCLPSELYLPAYSYSPEEIFKGKILLFNINFFRQPITIKEKTKIDEDGKRIVSYYYYEDPDGDELDIDDDGTAETRGYVTSQQDSAGFLQKTISSWYNAIRNICLVLMLSVLVYIGIRILLSSVASDKAKYHTMLKDWFIGLCLLFLMHYIMAFSVTIVEKLTDIVGSSLDNGKYIAIIPHTDQIEKDLTEIGMEESLRVDKSDAAQGYAWPSNLMGYLRLKAQLDSNGWQYIGEAIMFLMLVIFTVMFTFTYLKRLLYMTFLTLIAPVVALTYCIDKLNDGQAQGFNKWFKEYIFNLLIQPMHLFLYYILITSAFDVVGENVLFSIVAIGFMIPAEKLLRSLFGFEKAHTPPAMGPAGAMMASTALNSLLHKGPKGNSDSKTGASDGDSANKIPRVKDEINPIEALTDGGQGNNKDEGSQPHELNDEGQAWQNHIENPQNQSEELPQGGTNPYQGGNTELDEDGQQLLDNIENPQNQLDTPYQADNPYQEGSTELNEEGQQLLDNIENSQNQIDDFHKESSQPSGEEQQPQPRQEDSIEFEPKTQNAEPKKEKKGKIRRAVGRRANAVKMVGKTAARQAAQNAKKLPGKGIRMAGRGIAGVAVGAMAAGAGIAIGAATGDMSNVVKMGAGLGASGFAIGSGTIKNAHVKQEYKDVYKEAMNSGEYKEDAINDYIKNYTKDPRNQAYFENKFGKKEAKEMLQKGGEVEQYLRNGITDKNEMKAMHKLINDKDLKEIDTVEKAISVSKLGAMVGSDTNNMTAKKRDEWKTRFGNMAQGNVSNKEEFAERTLKEIDKFNDFKNK